MTDLNHKHCLWSISVAILLLCNVCGADDRSREYQVKAAFVYNFTQFIQWPAGAFENDSSPFIVGVVGQDPFEGSLEKMVSGKIACDRPIEVRHFSSVADIRNCQLLFVPAAQEDVQQIIDRTANKPVLIVGESEALMAAGGAIRLYLDDGKMRFELNPDVCQSASLRVSAKLMKLAKCYKK